MSIFVDTSALIAFLDADQPRHAEVIDTWDRAIADEKALFTSNYVLVESFALVQRRLGLEALRALADVLVPMLRVLWVDEELHAAAVASLFTARRRRSKDACPSFLRLCLRESPSFPRKRESRDFDENSMRLHPREQTQWHSVCRCHVGSRSADLATQE